MVAPRRGDIWWVRQPAGDRQSADRSEKRRPCLVVSADPWNLVEEYPRVTVCPITGAENVPRRYDTDVFLKKKDSRLSKDAVARCVEIYTVFRGELIARAGWVPPRRMSDVDRALAVSLSLPPAGIGRLG